eukprot:10188539-Ditylum_brightwellii.AAC.1
MAQNSGSSLHGTSPKSTERRRRLTHQGNSIYKAPRSRNTLRSIMVQNNDNISNMPPSASNEQTEENNMNNTSLSISNEAVEENNIQDTMTNTSTNNITITNNTTTDKASNKS